MQRDDLVSSRDLGKTIGGNNGYCLMGFLFVCLGVFFLSKSTDAFSCLSLWSSILADLALLLRLNFNVTFPMWRELKICFGIIHWSGIFSLIFQWSWAAEEGTKWTSQCYWRTFFPATKVQPATKGRVKYFSRGHNYN